MLPQEAGQDASLLENWRCDGSFPGSVGIHLLQAGPPPPPPEQSQFSAPSQRILIPHNFVAEN
jgi:hypothetical protein